MRAVLFPGQGSQVQGMGKELFSSSLYTTDRADAIDKIVGYSLKSKCINGPASELTQTHITQPCLYTVNALSFEHFRESGGTADFYAGHSLGEFNALYAAGCFDFLTGLKIVKERGRLMSSAPKGGMAAVIGCSIELIKSTLVKSGLLGIDLANFNTPAQIVISGPVDEIAKSETALLAAGAKAVIILPVGAAFHSRYMLPLADEFDRYLQQFEFAMPDRPVIANVLSSPYPSNGSFSQSSIREHLVRQFSESVFWAPSVAYLKRAGVIEFEELGPGKTLSRMIDQIPADVKVPADVQKPTPINESKNPGRQTVVSSVKPGNGSHTAHSSDGRSSKRLIDALGSATFRSTYGTRHAHATGSMYRGIASVKLVVALANKRQLGFFGAGGLDLESIDKAIQDIQSQVKPNAPFGINLLNQENAELEEATVDLILKYDVRNIEAAAFVLPTPALVRLRLQGLSGSIDAPNNPRYRILAKVSRPEVASAFMRPPPDVLIEKLLKENKITPEQASLGRQTPLADDVCVESDSAGHTDGGVALALLPTILLLRDQIAKECRLAQHIRIGAAGGIGTPQAVLAAFIMGADFVMTGSINQCTVEADTSSSVKDLLQSIGPQDTAYAPAGDMFEIGATVQVARKGLFFHVRANKLLELYKQYDSLDDLPVKVKQQLEQKYFKRSFDEVWDLVQQYYERKSRDISNIANNPKKKMAAVFKWYFHYSNQIALKGDTANRVDYQIHCGPAMGAFNQWVKDGPMSDWRHRSVSQINEQLMLSAASLMEENLKRYNKYLTPR